MEVWESHQLAMFRRAFSVEVKKSRCFGRWVGQRGLGQSAAAECWSLNLEHAWLPASCWEWEGEFSAGALSKLLALFQSHFKCSFLWGLSPPCRTDGSVSWAHSTSYCGLWLPSICLPTALPLLPCLLGIPGCRLTPGPLHSIFPLPAIRLPKIFSWLILSN